MTYAVFTKVNIYIAIMTPRSLVLGICKGGIAKTIHNRTEFAIYLHVREQVPSNG
jgi:hypothetical protein